LRKIGHFLGVVTALALATVSIGVGAAGTAEAASQRTAGTRAQWQAAIGKIPQRGAGCFHASYPALRWHAVTCAAAPAMPVVPAAHAGTAASVRGGAPALVGDGTDYSAQSSGLISLATGTFQDVSPGITVKGKVGNEGTKKANGFSLQLNSQFFSGSPACAGSGDPSGCLAWQQFVYTYQSRTLGYIFMQYWLINYDATCPSGWFTYSTDCYTNSPSATVSTVTAADLASLQLMGVAASGGQDEVSLSVGSGQATRVSNSDSVVDLAAFWNTTEWGLYGDGGGGEAYFSTGATLEAQTTLVGSSSAAPACVKEGFTGETNNLKLAKTPALGSETSPTMASKQTNGTPGKASCAVAA
jgi:hypothetical protein